MKPNVCHSLRSHACALAPLAGLSFLCLAATPAECATSITNSLQGFTGDSESGGGANQPPTLAGSGLNVTFVWPGGDASWEKIGFSTTGATFGIGTPIGNGDDNGRNYLRTNDVDYATVSFTAYVTIDRTARESVFFGMGTGALGSSKAPDIGTGNASVFLDLQDGFDNASRRVLGGISGASTNTEAGYTGMTTIIGPMRLRMDYNALAQTMDYAIDYNPSGSFVADQSFATVDVSSIAPEWATGENSSIYFGTQGYVSGGVRTGMTFTDFSVTVVPEPAAAFLSALGLLGFLRRRR